MTETTRETIEAYQIMAYATKDTPSQFVDDEGYEEWGSPRSSKEEAIEDFNEKLDFLREHSKRSSAIKAKYEAYKSHPVKIVKIINEITTKTTMTNELITI